MNKLRLAVSGTLAAALLTSSALAYSGTVIAPSGLNLRSEASTDSVIYSCALYGSKVDILDTVSDKWLMVEYGGKTGYMSAEWLKADSENEVISEPETSSTGNIGALEGGNTSTEISNLGVCTGSDVRIRAGASLNDAILGYCNRGDYVTLLDQVGEWYHITVGDIDGYMFGQYVRSAASAGIGSDEGQSIVNDAMQYLGVPYVYGGTSPYGFDCSGLVYYIYGQHGYSLYRGAEDQWLNGYEISTDALQPGDLVFFSGDWSSTIEHVGIYIGGGQFVHASSGGSCVKVNNLSDWYYSTYWYGAVRVIG